MLSSYINSTVNKYNTKSFLNIYMSTMKSSSSNIVNKTHNFEPFINNEPPSDSCNGEWGASLWSTSDKVGAMENNINTEIDVKDMSNNYCNKKIIKIKPGRRRQPRRMPQQVGHCAPTLNNLPTLVDLSNDNKSNGCNSRRFSLSSTCSNWSSAYSTPRKTPRDNQIVFDIRCLCHPHDHELDTNNNNNMVVNSGPRLIYPSVFEGTNKFPSLLKEVQDALSNGGSLKLAEEGEGGTYFVREKDGNAIAVFKPFDEEPGACNNPRGNVSPPMIGDIMAGTSWLREIAAHSLDYDGFSGVPETIGVILPSSCGVFKKDKKGSLQRFVVPKNGGKMVPAADLTPGKFSVEDVHRIGILDLRLCNCDRHGGNILANVNTNNATNLVPIDHGFVLPLTLRDLDFEWLWYPQASVPFSSNSLNYISRLDEDKDVSRLIELGLERKAVNLCKAATITLKTCAKNGWCLKRIGELLRPENLTDESPIETAMLKSSKDEDVVDWGEFKNMLETMIRDCPTVT